MNKRILIVEDEKNIVDILSFNLGREGPTTGRRDSSSPWSRTRTLSCWI